MLALGLERFIDELTEISAQASKEFALENVSVYFFIILKFHDFLCTDINKTVKSNFKPRCNKCVQMECQECLCHTSAYLCNDSHPLRARLYDTVFVSYRIGFIRAAKSIGTWEPRSQKVLRLRRKFSAKFSETGQCIFSNSFNNRTNFSFSTLDQKLFNVLFNVSNKELSNFGRPF